MKKDHEQDKRRRRRVGLECERTKGEKGVKRVSCGMSTPFYCQSGTTSLPWVCLADSGFRTGLDERGGTGKEGAMERDASRVVNTFGRYCTRRGIQTGS